MQVDDHLQNFGAKQYHRAKGHQDRYVETYAHDSTRHLDLREQSAEIKANEKQRFGQNQEKLNSAWFRRAEISPLFQNKTNGKDRGQREETTDSAYQSIDPFVRIAYWFVIDIDIDRKIHIIVH